MESKTFTSIELTAGDRMMLTDGVHVVKAVLLPAGDDGSKWREITVEEAMELKKKLRKNSNEG